MDPVRQNPVAAPRKRAEIVRKRLSQPQQTTDAARSMDPTRTPSLAPSHLSEASSSKDTASTRPLKRKISPTTPPQVPSDRPENRNVNPNRPLLDVSSYTSHVPPPRTTAQPGHAPHSHSNSSNQNAIASGSSSFSQKRPKGAAVRLPASSLHHCNPHDAHNHRHCPIPSEHSFTGPLAAAEFQRMRKEIESLKEAFHELTKTSKKQAKKLEENKTELSAMQTLAQTKELELASVKEKHKKAEEVISTIEMSVQCQICMDLPEKPFALSPCGHVLCLLCLQEWFKKAPPSLDDMDISPEELSDPNYILMRSKSCPTCRATIKRRPAPVFMVKAVAATLMKHNNSAPPLPTAAAEDEDAEPEDPWKGIFASSEEEDDDDDYDDDYDSDYGGYGAGYAGGFTDSEGEEDHSDFEEDEANWAGHRPYPMFGYHSDDDDEDDDEEDGVPYGAMSDEQEGDDDDGEDEDEHDDEDDTSTRGTADIAEVYDDEEDGEDDHEGEEDEEHDAPYIHPRWSPPIRRRVDISQYDLITRDEYKLLQRGCTIEMIRGFDVTYNHDLGIILRTQNLPHLGRGVKRMFLGWNVYVHDSDVHGVRFVMEMLADVVEHGEHWAAYPSEEEGCVVDVHLLLPPSSTQYVTSDSEAWMDDE